MRSPRITFASIRLLTKERPKALSGCSLLHRLSKSVSSISFVTVFVTGRKSLVHFDTNITI